MSPATTGRGGSAWAATGSSRSCSNPSGKRTVFVIGGLLVFSVVNLALGLVTQYWQLFILRIVQGGAAAFTITASIALVNEGSQADSRGRHMGIYNSFRLVGFGSGPDVGPVVDLAKRVDFRVTVVGFRGAQATSEAFPAADEVLASSPANVESAVAFDPDTYAVVMTHNFVDDRLVLEALLDTPVPYIGLMGPTERFEELLDAFADEGVTLPEDAFERIHTPIGLDLGGDSPYRIAYSIVGELLTVANDRTPQHLSEREGPIHDRTTADPETADRTTPE
ncbi:MAG: hypothetical protein BRD24_06365 [Halobacteriales archaeon SW_9_67_24]|nr:MAG: hypothetical protein BRD24_06365 [Halobacteriales archaeon SW_9_67_24]